VSSSSTTPQSTVYGYPRQGPNRELKKAVEGYWAGRVDAGALEATAAGLRRDNWHRLAEAGVTEVPTGDFSLYDHVLDATVAVGAIRRATAPPSTPIRWTATSPWPAAPRTPHRWR
jgi:5-methyltetrahydropteroyltriglutamate--homocysteine methyltransferase